ncbi:MAG TPA: nuclear transport factor 2 family protein [Gemmatimonadaceae bacterium]|nr:nuclear transport factor 2 family protein [Gemmatimonadaceae bacterium]
MRRAYIVILLVGAVACGGDQTAAVPDAAAAQESILAAHDAMVAAMVEGRPTAELHTAEWSGVNLNGTPMSATGFEGEERAMQYDTIQVLNRDVRVYGDVAALRWHANFYVKVNGNPSFAEMRLLDVYVLKGDRWLLDLTQVTPVFGTVGNPPGA